VPNHEGSAESWLAAYLASGPMLATELVAQGKADGFSKERLDRAKSKIGATSKRNGYGGQWWWLLPGQVIQKGGDEL